MGVRTVVFVSPKDEDVHGSDFGNLLVISIEPENLLAVLSSSFFSNIDRRGIIAKEIRLTAEQAIIFKGVFLITRSDFWYQLSHVCNKT